jgi:putative peptide zinc metalloprotease protein
MAAMLCPSTVDPPLETNLALRAAINKTYGVMQTFTIERVEHKKDTFKFMLTVNNKVFYVGELIAFIVERLSEGRTAGEIATMINEKNAQGYKLSEEQMEQIIQDKIKTLGIFGAGNPDAVQSNSPLSRIGARWTITRFERIEPLLQYVRQLYWPAVFIPLLLLLIAGNSWFFYIVFTKYGATAKHLISNTADCQKSIYFFLLFYPAAIATLYMHEIGHAAASYRFGVTPRNIGMGIYLIFPVLYTELNGAWKLGRGQRLIINLGGIYLQLLINLFFFLLVFRVQDPNAKEVLRYLIKLNVLTVFLNLNPFLKFDGYWIISDLFRLPNLNQQSNYYIVRLVNWLFPRIKVKVNPNVASIIRPWNPVLIVYSFLKYAFVLSLVYSLIRGSYYSYKNIIIYSGQMVVTQDYTLCSVETLVKQLFSVAVLSYFLVTVSRNFVKGVRRLKK